VVGGGAKMGQPSAPSVILVLSAVVRQKIRFQGASLFSLVVAPMV